MISEEERIHHEITEAEAAQVNGGAGLTGVFDFDEVVVGEWYQIQYPISSTPLGTDEYYYCKASLGNNQFLFYLVNVNLTELGQIGTFPGEVVRNGKGLKRRGRPYADQWKNVPADYRD